MKFLTRSLIFLGVCVILFALAVVMFGHRTMALRVLGLTFPEYELGEPTDEGLDAIWFDDYFTIFRIDDDTYAIGETRYHQVNFNYLLIGADRALLLDSGPGVRDITAAVRSLTPLPVTSVASHLHYDHVGGYNRFEAGAMIDLPHLRERAGDGPLPLTPGEHLGYVEGFHLPELNVTEWWAPGVPIDLGERSIMVYHTPGHTPESIVLEDRARKQFFTGDSYYPGDLFVFLPSSSIGDFVRSTDNLVKRISDDATLYGAHRQAPNGLPTLSRDDLLDLQNALHILRDGEAGELAESGFFPKEVEVNKHLRLLIDFAGSRRWDP